MDDTEESVCVNSSSFNVKYASEANINRSLEVRRQPDKQTVSSGNTSATSGYKKRQTSLSDVEAKEKPEHEQPKEIHGEVAEGNLLLCNFILVALAIDFLVIYTFFLTLHRDGLKIAHNRTTLETSRKALQVMSDSLDCSLLIKEAALEKFIVQHQILLGVACLALVVPYSVRPHSSLTMMMYYKQNREGWTQSYRDGDFEVNLNKDLDVLERCVAYANCSRRSHHKLMRSYVEFNKNFNDSFLKFAWMAPDMDLRKASQWLSRNLKDLSNLTDIDKHLLPRKFKKTRTYLAMNSSPGSNHEEFLYDRTKSHIVLSDERLKYIVNNFLQQRRDEKFTRRVYDYCIVPLLPDMKSQRLELRLPCGESSPISSILSAFIIRIVREVALTTNFHRGHMDSGFYSLFLRISKIAEYIYSSYKRRSDTLLPIRRKKDTDFVKVRTIDEHNKRSLFYREAFSTAIEMYNNHTDLQLPHPERNITDRVASAIIWQLNIRETILMVNLGLTMDGRRSDAASTASIMVVNKTMDEDDPIIVATASGSIRTIEAVASVVLRMLLFDENPGEAILANASFYDSQKRTFFCENTDKRFLEEMARNGTNCSFPIPGYSAQHDRIAMAARRQRNGRIVAAVDPRPREFNYAVGF